MDRLFIMSVHEKKDPDDKHTTRDFYKLVDQRPVISEDDAKEEMRHYLTRPDGYKGKHELEFFYAKSIGDTF